MTLYSIFDRDTAAPEAPAVIAEKFSWLAALLPPVFCLAHGLWAALVGFVAAVLLIALGSLWLGPDAAFWLYVLLAAFIGLEAPALRRAALGRRGWRYRTERFAPTGELAQVEWLQRAGAAR